MRNRIPVVIAIVFGFILSGLSGPSGPSGPLRAADQRR